MFEHILNVLNLDNPGFQWLLAFLTIDSTVVILTPCFYPVFIQCGTVALCFFVVLMLIVVPCRCPMSPMLLCIPSSLF